jgi:hypothetical protein
LEIDCVYGYCDDTVAAAKPLIMAVKTRTGHADAGKSEELLLGGYNKDSSIAKTALVFVLFHLT